MSKVYIQKWNKQDAPWERILVDILKVDYEIEECPPILRDAFGKPYLKGSTIYFNVSHSGDYLAIAISERPVGIDIQEEKIIRDGMYRKVVQPNEELLIGEEKQKDFLRLWSLKESFVKAEGKGLRISMKDYYFKKEKSGFCVIYNGQRAAWTFNIEETLIEGYFISVCSLETEVQWIVK